ncbi:glutathione S-transferase 1-like [Clavelina lepadiformis]|uniref:glutathione transferase n=1 Tax=Clavelina lepadiformis TaxID=159417 RepID=A0ABP0F3I0_CLALP
MPKYRLMYFPIKGRAEVARLIFAQAGQEYEDLRISSSDWPAKKPETPFGQMPVLYIDDKPLPQSDAIVRYLAREFKLEGPDSMTTAYVDMLVMSMKEAVEKLPFMEKDEEKKKKAKEAAFEKIDFTFGKIEKKFKDSGKEFLFKELTYADLYLLQMSEAIGYFDKDLMKKFPSLDALIARVKNLPNIKNWLEKRPNTDF